MFGLVAQISAGCFGLAWPIRCLEAPWRWEPDFAHGGRNSNGGQHLAESRRTLGCLEILVESDAHCLMSVLGVDADLLTSHEGDSRPPDADHWALGIEPAVGGEGIAVGIVEADSPLNAGMVLSAALG